MSRRGLEKLLVVIPGIHVCWYIATDGHLDHGVLSRLDQLPHGFVAVQLGKIVEDLAAEPERVPDAILVPADRDCRISTAVDQGIDRSQESLGLTYHPPSHVGVCRFYRSRFIAPDFDFFWQIRRVFSAETRK